MSPPRDQDKARLDGKQQGSDCRDRGGRRRQRKETDKPYSPSLVNDLKEVLENMRSSIISGETGSELFF